MFINQKVKSKILTKSKLKYISDSLTAIKKAENQDNLLILEESDFTLFVIFDGVGSAKNSKKATTLACEYIKKNSKELLSENSGLANLMHRTNEFILDQKIPETLTTYCIVYLSSKGESIISYSSMGDTRLYLKSKQYFEQITVDDRVEGSKNIITKCLGMDSLDISDFKQYTVDKSDNNILICTDGFYNFLEDDRLGFFEVLSKRSLKLIKDNLKVIIDKNNTDDSTYIFIK